MTQEVRGEAKNRPTVFNSKVGHLVTTPEDHVARTLQVQRSLSVLVQQLCICRWYPGTSFKCPRLLLNNFFCFSRLFTVFPTNPSPSVWVIWLKQSNKSDRLLSACVCDSRLYPFDPLKLLLSSLVILRQNEM